MTIFLRLFLLISSLYLAGCTTISPNREPENQNLPWNSRVQLLSNIQNWNLQALVGIRAKQEAGSVSLRWQQQSKNYNLLLFGPLGTHTYQLKGTAGRVELEDPNGKKFIAKTPEQVLAAQTGWHLPVSYLYYWIRGLPVPGLPVQKQWDSYNHLSELTQQNWQIHFLRYTATKRGDLPEKILINSPGLTIKIIISQWQV